MAIKAIENFKKQYPFYKDAPDIDVARGLEQMSPEYSGLVQAVSRDQAIDKLPEHTQRSARMAEGRKGLLNQLADEVHGPVSYPWEKDFWTKRTPIPEKISGPLSMGSPMPIIRAAGAPFQMAEAALSSVPVGMQRGTSYDLDNPTSWSDRARILWRTVADSITGKAPTEFGDVVRNDADMLGLDPGLSEAAAKGTGLLTAGILPGVGEATKFMNTTRAGLVSKINKPLSKVTRTGREFQLTKLAGVKEGSAETMLDTDFADFKVVGKRRAEQEIADTVRGGVGTARALRKSVQQEQDDILRQYGETSVPVDAKSVLTEPMRVLKQGNVIRGLDGDGNLIWKTSADSQNLRKVIDEFLRLAEENVTTPGLVEKGAQLPPRGRSVTISQIKGLRDDLDEIISGSGSNTIKDAAYKMKDALAEVRRTGGRVVDPATGLTDIGRADARYATAMGVLEKDSITGQLGVEDLLKATGTGQSKAERLHSYNSLVNESKIKALDQLTGGSLLSTLRTKIANAEFQNIFPHNRNISIAAVGASILRPDLAMGLGGAYTASSPLLNALLGKVLGIGRKQMTKMANLPVSRTIAGLMDRGIVSRTGRYEEGQQ